MGKHEVEVVSNLIHIHKYHKESETTEIAPPCVKNRFHQVTKIMRRSCRDSHLIHLYIFNKCQVNSRCSVKAAKWCAQLCA